MRISMLVSLIRPTGPIIVGISLGFTLSLLSVTWVNESCDSDWMGAADEMLIGQPGSSKGARKPSSISSGTTDNGNVEEDFEPRIVPYNKPAQEGPPKKVFRSKYASTELGIREHLFVSVFTSKATMNTLAVAINRTLNHHLDGRLIFFTGTRNRKLPNGMFVVAHGDERPVPNMYQSVRYLLKHHIAEYDWFYLVQDDTYTQPERLKSLVSHLSMGLQLYMGRPGEFIGGETQGRYCHSGPGFLLSRALLLKLQPFLEQCRTDIISVRPDEWLGRCIIDYVGMNCVEEYESEIKNVSEVAADGNKSALWPIGITPPFEPKNRFEVLRWDYFTEDNLFSCVDGAPKCQLSGADRDDVTDVIKVAVEELNKKYNPFVQLSAPRLVNGYRRLDQTRGMEYTLDLQVQATTESGHQKSIARRVHLVRPLSQVEIIPMPYVTEATRVHIFLPLTSYESHVALHFLDHCSTNLFETGENAVLNFLFTYEPAEAQKVSTNDVFAEVKAKITAIERRYPSVKVSWISIKTESPGVLRILDIVSRKHPVETLFLLVTADTVLNSEFLNRCRMNTISGWQAFFPIHFQDFDPSVAYPDQVPPSSQDLVREAGHFDRYTFEEACFYNSDYMSSRTRMSGDLQENEELLESLDLYDMFVQYSGLHVFRAVEPALRQAYRNRTCDPRLSEDVFHRCLQSSLESHGSRSQLAMLIFEQEQGNST
ncbi:chondroitin sulfate synthase 2 isoform X2 [Chanodichthys erythropterus]|uniref:chondroitin sulfate synthase 2 isoform X2 n=1 Tax=Chanodichthys erythropterus TaxID=933992 RepID=UPI00351F182A